MICNIATPVYSTSDFNINLGQLVLVDVVPCFGVQMQTYFMRYSES